MAADRGHQRSGIALLFLGAAVAMLALTTHQPRWLLLSLCALAGLGTLGTQNLINAYVARYYPPRLRGTALGFTLGTGRFGSVAGPSYLTLTTTLFTTPDAAFYAFALPALLGATTMALIPPRTRT
ncbi:MFS transporter [Streptomyces sp. DSM 44917]|uniref:MFS transporter n=1 Tax=Streptomyces boetiae TaxID=3075541 RepID=A0ABU2L844_9ACTN|nr:MFS transporter [Streptomyces sp. DSM 44917]MDT0307739.1 MFS transporter [Streptomyces sp. DSM 44917]